MTRVDQDGVIHDDADVFAELLETVSEMHSDVDNLSKGMEVLNADVGTLAQRLILHLAEWEDPGDELAHWVDDWLIPTFALRTVLAGWETEPAIRSELQALWIGYQKMAAAREASFDPLSWHEYLPRLIDRVHDHRARRTNDERSDGRPTAAASTDPGRAAERRSVLGLHPQGAATPPDMLSVPGGSGMIGDDSTFPFGTERT